MTLEEEIVDVPQNFTDTNFDRFLVYHKSYMKSFTYDEIALFVLQDRDTKLITHSGEIYSMNKTINSIELKLPIKKFFRINRHCIISYESILRIEPFFGNRLVVFLKSNACEKVVVSRPRVQSFKNWLGE